MRAAFWFSAVIGTAARAIWWLSAGDTLDEHPDVSVLELRTIRDGLASIPDVPGVGKADKAGGDGPNAVVISWRAIFRRRDLAPLMAGYFALGYIGWVFFSWFFLYMAQVRGLDLKSSALYSMLPFLSMTVFCLVGEAMSDWLGKSYGLRADMFYVTSSGLFH